MLTATVETIARVTGGELLVGDPALIANDVSIDSRSAAPGCVFFALRGERSDGHDHLNAAFDAGARVAVVERAPAGLVDQIAAAGVAVVRVAAVEKALADLASWHRSRLHCTVVGVTGSNGKTTTKDFLCAALGATRRVVATQGNRNNELGVPLTVMRAGADTDVLIVEMGMRGLGQIASLARIARPDVGLVTNVGVTHVEVLGSQDAIASAKGELVEAIGLEGAVYLNGDDAYTHVLQGKSAAPVVTYGLSEECDVRAADIVMDDQSRPGFDIVAGELRTHVDLPVPGRHNVYNALAAAAVAAGLGVPLEEVASQLAHAETTGMRMESFTTASGVTIINDAYNASPSSMHFAVETLAGFSAARRRIAVLGDMAELGSLTELAHFDIGELVARSNIDVLLTVGTKASRIADGARAEGMDADVVRPCATADEALEVLDDVVERGDVVLVKASRVMGLERVVEGMVEPRVG